MIRLGPNSLFVPTPGTTRRISCYFHGGHGTTTRYVSMKRSAILVLLVGGFGVASCAVTPTTPTQPTAVEVTPPKISERPKRSHEPCATRQDCAKVLHQVITNEWLLPAGPVEKGTSATILIDLAPDGWARQFTITKSSGNLAFDKSIERALLRAQPFDELKGLKEVSINRGIQLEFRFAPQ